jgi:hypothetical protein
MLKLAIILIILIGIGVLGVTFVPSIASDFDAIKVVLDAATKEAIDKGEFVAPGGVSFVESKDCEGTQWIKKQDCSLNGSPMDGAEGSCGLGKEIWILDPTHPDFKPAIGDGKCEPQERDCETPCPKGCEGETWIEGSCVRKDIVNGSIIETVLDGTTGKCGDGITTFNLDTTAADYKPAIGSGACVTEKGGVCNIPCPIPEPPKCTEYAPGWQDNDMGCVRSQTDLTPVKCGETGTRNQYKIPVDVNNCPELTQWVDCTGPPCPIDCVGTWSEWSDRKSDEPCGVQPYKERTFTVTKQAAHGGKVCEYPDGDVERQNSGAPIPCCEEDDNWAMVGACEPDGTAKYTQTYRENKPGGCPSSAKAKFLACCYQKNDWRDTTVCNSIGRKTQQQTTAGNCPDNVKTKQVDCPFVGNWTAATGCLSNGQQSFTRIVVNNSNASTEVRTCCYPGVWGAWGQCDSNGNQTRYRTPINCDPGYISSFETRKCCFDDNWVDAECHPGNRKLQRRTPINCPGRGTEERWVEGGCSYQKCNVQTWKHQNWSDHSWIIQDSVHNVQTDSRTNSRHDEVTSYRKWGGNCTAIAYEHQNYGGRTIELQEGYHHVPSWFNDKLSSISIQHHSYRM